MKTVHLFAFLVIVSLSAFAQKNQDNMTAFNFEKAWKEVEEYSKKALPESALKTVNTIYEHAKLEKDAAQIVKAIVHQLKFTDDKEENAFVKNLVKLRVEAEAETFPVKSLLHSMLGEMYWQYYQHNRYRFHQRSTLSGVKQDDIETWTLNKVVEETLLQYKLSLENAEQLKATKIDLYEEVLHNGNSLGRRYRPTLFDFLAHRAVDFASGEEASITQPVYAFNLDNENYFADARAFAQLNIESRDTLSLTFFAVRVLQQIIAFHLDDKDPQALIDADIRRFSFVNRKSALPTKAELYLNALEELEKKHIDHTASTRVTHLIANVYAQTAGLYRPLLSDDHKWDNKTAIEICATARDRFPDSEGAIDCETCSMPFH